MRTLIVSDLHLGGLSHTDLLRREDMRAELLGQLAEVDRVVLLGDVLELRHGPMRDALAAARPFFEDLGETLAGGNSAPRGAHPEGRTQAGELVIVPGNHDHQLVEPWLAARGDEHEPPALGVEQLLEPAEASPALARIAGWAAPARVRVAYPGLWLRPDVYATHGHYLDCHLTVPTLERLSVGAMSRVLGKPARAFAAVGDYETTVAPMFAWRDAVARDARTGAALNGKTTVAAWDALSGSLGGRGRSRVALKHRLRRYVLGAGFPLAVAALNRAGIGPLGADLSLSELRRAGLAAMGEVAARLDLGHAYVVFGHTHRPGPLPDDDPQEWRGRAGARLINTGSWTYSSIFVTNTPGESPYWPGTYVLLEEHGPPQVRRMLLDRPRAHIESPALGLS
jgi:predicted phosphodiesterase